jgi:hypothetical protein
MMEFLAPPLGARLMMATSLYTALISGLSLSFLGIFVLLWLPETLEFQSSTETLTAEDTASMQDSPTDDSSSTPPTKGFIQSFRDSVHDSLKPLGSMAKLIANDRNVLLSLPVFLVSRFSRQLMAVLLQYGSKRLGWTLASVCMFLLTDLWISFLWINLTD